jgi:FKBP-type peptidyl-prolyl cis-trans isomerase
MRLAALTRRASKVHWHCLENLYPIMFQPYKMFKWLFVMALLAGCKPIADKPRSSMEDAPMRPEDNEAYQIERNRDFLQKERASIEAYIKDRNWQMQRTGNGLYYQITQPGNGGKKPVLRDQVEVQVTSYLFDGTVILAPGRKRIGVGTDSNFEMGFHEALLLMEPDMKAVFILPSHLAHGLAGDLNKVPPMSALVYEVQLLTIY